MANSNILIQFLFVPQVDDFITLHESNYSLNLNMIFKKNRLASRQVALPVFLPDDGIDPDRYIGFCPVNLRSAFNLDFNSTGLFTVEDYPGISGTGVGAIRITANYPNAVFILNSYSGESMSITVDNQISAPSFNITNVEFQQSDTPCTHVNVALTTNVMANNIVVPITGAITTNPYVFKRLRGESFLTVLEGLNGIQSGQYISTPPLLNPLNFNVNTNNSPNGATAIVSQTYALDLILQYSLDNISWQSSNVFSGLLAGDFTLFVKDQYGYSFSKSFSISEFNISSPYFYISKSNSIRFADRNTSNYRNDENTLSCEDNAFLLYKEVQQFQSNDVITIQFKSNFQNNIAKVMQENGIEVLIPVNKLSSNIGQKDKRDGRKYTLGNGKTGIYFLAGNVYDYDTNAIIDIYSLNGSLPLWADTKNYMIIDNAWYKIEEIIFDEDKNAEVLVIIDNYSGLELNCVVGSIYNLFKYEVYEFEVNMNDFNGQNIRVKLENSDPDFGSTTHLSEEINITTVQENTIEIVYRNSDNTDVFYNTGIEHKIRQPYTKINAISDEQSEIYKTDTNTVMLSAEVYEVTEFVLEPVTKEMMRKIIQALSHKIVFIDEVGYAKNGNIEIDGPLADTNLYVIKAKMIKNGYVYNATSGDNDEIFTGGVFEIPGIINTDVGFLAY